MFRALARARILEARPPCSVHKKLLTNSVAVLLFIPKYTLCAIFMSFADRRSSILILSFPSFTRGLTPNTAAAANNKEMLFQTLYRLLLPILLEIRTRAYAISQDASCLVIREASLFLAHCKASEQSEEAAAVG